MNIFNKDEQFEDLFKIEANGSKGIVSNPLNILWLLENNTISLNMNESAIVSDYIQKLKLKLPKLNKNATRTIKKYSNVVLRKVLLDENNLLNRMNDLINKGVNINNKLNLIIEYKSPLLIEKALNYTVDINHIEKKEQKIYYPMKTALATRSSKIAQMIYENEHLDKEMKDEKNNNLAFLAVKYQQLEIVEDIIKTMPNLLYEKGIDNISAIELFFSKEKTISSKKSLALYKKISFNIFDLDNDKVYLLDEKIKSSISNHLIFKNFLVEYNYINLNKALAENETNKKRLKI